MIATVRIAPVERWCERAKTAVAQYPREEVADQIAISIETSSMKTILGERAWLVLSWPEDVEFFGGTHVCEHMLEMD